jgi:hypothetical protein
VVRVGRAVRYPVDALRGWVQTQQGRAGTPVIPDDYLDRNALTALGISDVDADSLLRDSPLTGHGGQPVVEAERLPELLAMLLREKEAGK